MISILNIKPLMTNERGEDAYPGDFVHYVGEGTFTYKLLSGDGKAIKYQMYQNGIEWSGGSTESRDWKRTFNNTWKLYDISSKS